MVNPERGIGGPSHVLYSRCGASASHKSGGVGVPAIAGTGYS